MKRYITKNIQQDWGKKILLLTGPRQAGKTTLSKQLAQSYDYFNYDNAMHRIDLSEQSWDRKKELIIFDELHKMQNWKQWIKGIYDVEGQQPQLLVTGSAKLDTYRKVGDSLAGRYFQHRLHPLDIKELADNTELALEDIFNRLIHCGNFPEPFFQGEEKFYRRWQRTHMDIIIRQDLLDLESVEDIQSVETLVALLRKRVGGQTSYANLARDLGKDPSTVKRWLTMLENLYVIFPVRPYHRNIARAILKEPKYYFYDTAAVVGDSGAKLENLVACALIKAKHYCIDSTGCEAQVHYLRTKDGKELDFFITIDDLPKYLLEVKYSDTKPSQHFTYFSKYFPNVPKIQLVKELAREKTYPDGSELRQLLPWLSQFSLVEPRSGS